MPPDNPEYSGKASAPSSGAKGTDPQAPAGPANASSGVPRRSFLTRALASVIGVAIVLVPLAAGVGFFFDPLFRRRRAARAGAGDSSGRDAEGFLRVASLASLPDNGQPQIFTVSDDLVDAWNKFPNQPVGRVYLRKLPAGGVSAFNVRCPHLGCAVDYRPSENDYFCPCHLSAFDLDGQRENEIPPRGMDSLDVKIKNGTEVWVRYQSFKAGTPEKIPV
jgi:Rieske Fe-S protein